MPNVLLRAAALEDAPAIAELHLAAWQATYRGMLPDDVLDGLSLATFTERRRRALAAPADPRMGNWVLDRSGDLVGWACAGPCRDADLGAGLPSAVVGEVHAIYLAPDAVGQGHGRRLFAHALAALAAHGFGEVVVWVLAANARARRFYERAGLSIDSSAPERHVALNQRVLDAPEVRMRGPLPPRPEGA